MGVQVRRCFVLLWRRFDLVFHPRSQSSPLVHFLLVIFLDLGNDVSYALGVRIRSIILRPCVCVVRRRLL